MKSDDMTDSRGEVHNTVNSEQSGRSTPSDFGDLSSSFPEELEYYRLPEPVAKPFRMKRRNFPIYRSNSFDSSPSWTGDFSISNSSPINYSPSLRHTPGYSSFRANRIRNDSVDSDDSKADCATSQSESEFWTPVVFRRRPTIPYSGTEVPETAEEAKETTSDESSTDSEDDKFLSRLSQKFSSSLSYWSYAKYKERNWYCRSCKRPRDRCHCMCTVS